MFYCFAIAASAALRWQQRSDRWIISSWLGEFAVGAFFIAAGGMPAIRNDVTALFWSIAILVPELIAVWRIGRLEQKGRVAPESGHHFSYPKAALIASGATLVSAIAVFARNHSLGLPSKFDLKQLEVLLFAIAEYTLLAVLLTTVLNILQLIARKADRASWAHPWAVIFLAFILLDASLLRFLSGALSIQGLAAVVYATLLSIYVVMWLYSLCGRCSVHPGRRPQAGDLRWLPSWLHCVSHPS